MSAALRLFVALELPEDVRAALARFRADATGSAAGGSVWRPVSDESLHLTLAFLGWHEEPAADRAGRVVREAGAGEGAGAARGGRPRLALADALLLPPGRPRVIGAAVDDLDGTLAALQGAVAERLVGEGLYEPEARPFRPHVTVARLRRGASAHRGRGRSRDEVHGGGGSALGRGRRGGGGPPERIVFRAPAITLFRSRLSPSGARYEALVRHAFAGGGTAR